MQDESWLVQATRLSRLVRPFDLKRLSAALYHVEADAADIRQRLQRMLIDPPRLADEFVFELDGLETCLMSLSARCGDAVPVVREMVDRADGDERRALQALMAIWETIPPEVVPLKAAA